MKVNNSFFQTPYIIAEVGQAHDGSLGIAHSFIDAVADTRVNAIKFQTHYAEEESSPEEPWRVKFSTQDNTRFEYWRRMEFTPMQWIEIGDHCRDRKLDFISSPFSIKAIEVLEKAGVDAYKIPSGEVNNILLLKAIAGTDKPVILSSGMSDFEEIDKAINVINKSHNEIVLLQCTTQYPVQPERIGFNVIQEMAKRYGCKVGLSDHSGEIFAALAAITLGAVCIEVHVTFSKSMFGPDTAASLIPDQLKELKKGADWLSRAIANPVDKNIIPPDLIEQRKIFTKSFAARKNIAQGKVITEKDICLRKPNKGISASNYKSIIGKRASAHIRAGDFITIEMIDKNHD